MKSRQRITWLIFSVCALLVLEGLGWVTWQMIRLEAREREARREADLQETLRLALWRMDSAVTPLIAAEASRPYFQYRPFYPAERAYTRMWEEVQPGEVLFPSPLLTGQHHALIRLHFEVGPGGALTSPQAPTGNMRDLAEGQYLSHERVQRAEQWLEELQLMSEGSLLPRSRASERYRSVTGADERENAGTDLQADAGQRGDAFRDEAGPAPTKGTDYAWRQRATEQAANTLPQQAEIPDDKRTQRRRQHQEAIRSIARQAEDRQDDADTLTDELLARRELGYDPASIGFDDVEVTGPTLLGVPLETTDSAPDIRQGPLEPAWRNDAASGRRELLFIREVVIDDKRIVQGFWVDWPRLRDELLVTIRDLFPAAQLEPVDDVGIVPAASGLLESELLASIPVRLIPASLPTPAASMVTSMRVTLALTWAAVLAAIAAIAFVLRASMKISERRGRFVSAVTHELRTPMTTFCLYSQMLADGMIREEDRRREYLGTLKQESQRLARIVENVLAYARLGRKQAAKARQALEVGELLDRILPALRRRAEQGGMTLVEELAPAVHEALIPSEREGIERILVNLVDNACKYAGSAPDKRVHLAAAVSRGRVNFRVTDHGPGVPKSERRRVFAPFKRGKRDDAGPNPGLGLGLALARGLARELGGDLRLLKSPGPGASFELSLPVIG